jgi:photosystem II stability/assembly factor-like uncharacterized protein
MVVYDFDVVWLAIHPNKAHLVLIVYPNAMLHQWVDRRRVGRWRPGGLRYNERRFLETAHAHPASPGTEAGVLKSADMGRTWQPASNGLPPGAVVTVIPHPRKRTVVYAGIRGVGVFRSADGGLTWAAVGEGLPESAFTGSIALAAGGGERLFAATDGRGVWKISLP